MVAQTFAAHPYAGPKSRRIAELHRRLEWLGPDARFETVLENLRVELGYPEGIGRWTAWRS